MRRLKLAILISGRGSNMEALIDAARAPDYPAEVVMVLSNRPDAAGLAFAEAAGIDAYAIDHKGFGKDRERFEYFVEKVLRERGIEIIALAGFMRVLTADFVSRWDGRMVNIHPSLLPKYKGLDTHQRAIDAGDTETGCTVHWVSAGVDEGEIIAQARLPIRPDDTAATLAARLLLLEHALYPTALAQACNRILSQAGSI